MVGPTLAADLRVVVADDHDISRHGLVDILSTSGAVVVAAVGDAESALDVLAHDRVSVLLVGLELSARRDPGLAQESRRRWPQTGVVMISDTHRDQDVLEAMAAGSSAYIARTASQEELVACLVAAAQAPGAFTAAGLAAASRRRARESVSPLTSRETEVLRLAADGLGVRDISAQLFITQATTRSHLAGIYRKLEVASRSRAVLVAERRGLLR